MKLKVFFIVIFSNYMLVQAAANRISQHFTHCYRGNETEPWTSHTIQHLIELIRKIEDAYPTSMDIRLISVNILHRLRLDGVERAPGIQETEFVTAFGPSGIMVPKFELLKSLISDTPTLINVDECLTKEEICHLHRMISSGVEPFHRGDETRTCGSNFPMSSRPEASWNRNKVQDPFTDSRRRTIGHQLSRCPLEKGVIRTRDYGSFSPGTFIASIAAGLQPQSVMISEFINYQEKLGVYKNVESMTNSDMESQFTKLKKSLDSIDNKYSAGLSGDLAEVCVYQGSLYGTNVTIGLDGFWNNTDLPTIRYLQENHNAHWEMPDSEVLAGIDSIFISEQILTWVNRIRRLKLSQIIDMYYSNRGIPTASIEDNKPTLNTRRRKLNLNVDSTGLQYAVSNACDRQNIVNNIDRDELKEQTYFLSQILQFKTSSLLVSDDILRRNCYAAVDKFFAYTAQLLPTLPECSSAIKKNSNKPSVDLTLIIDGSRQKHENKQLISFISEIIDVSKFSSNISVIHGTSGEYLINKTDSISTAFGQLRNFTGNYPEFISLSKSFSNLLNTLSRETRLEQNSGIIMSTSRVVLVMSQSLRTTETDFQSARRMLEGSLLQFPDLYFVFITNDSPNFNELIRNVKIGNRQNHYKVIQSNQANAIDFVDELVVFLKSVPKRIIPTCSASSGNSWNRIQFEDYISPYDGLIYRVDPTYIPFNTEIKFQFTGVDYGSFTVCFSRDIHFEKSECNLITGFDEIWYTFNICTNVDCPPIYISVTLDNTNIRCSENDCRYPDQIRFITRHEGLRCDGQRNFVNRLLNNVILFLFCMLLNLLVNIY